MIWHFKLLLRQSCLLETRDCLKSLFSDGSPTSLVAVQRVTQILLRFFLYRTNATTCLLHRSATDSFYAEGIAIAKAFANIAATVRPFIEAAQASIISAGESQEGSSSISANQFIASAFALLLRPALKALTLFFSSSSVAAVVSAADLPSRQPGAGDPFSGRSIIGRNKH